MEIDKKPFDWVIGRVLILIIFIPISIAWVDFLRPFLKLITEECPKEKCRDLPFMVSLLILLALTGLGIFILWLFYKYTTYLYY